LQSGFAWHYKAFDKSKKYADAEVKARQQKSGLWAGKNPTAPWDYRKAKRNKREAVAVM
jgi:endonuclease YncB( thermonuclease family)